MFKYPPEIRKLIYTTNVIENFNRQLRKVTKTKSAFVSDNALLKILYLTTMQIVDKWSMPIRNWGMILDNLMGLLWRYVEHYPVTCVFHDVWTLHKT